MVGQVVDQSTEGMLDGHSMEHDSQLAASVSELMRAISAASPEERAAVLDLLRSLTRRLSGCVEIEHCSHV